MFLPSGQEFAVGDASGRQAAVYLAFANGGPGVGGFDGYLYRGITPDTQEIALFWYRLL